ncbi:MAG: hypothetical protein AB8G96_04210 [Phycisphaerales bacterium]
MFDRPSSRVAVRPRRGIALPFAVALTTTIAAVAFGQAGQPGQAPGQTSSQTSSQTPPSQTPPAQPDITIPAVAPEPVPEAPPEARAILERARVAADAWTRFRADFSLVVRSRRTLEETVRKGVLLFDRGRPTTPPAAGDANPPVAEPALAILFRQEFGAGIAPKDLSFHYAVRGRWLADVNEADRTFNRYSIAAPGASFDPFRLGQGPFPLPIGQNPDDVIRAFDVQPTPLPRDGMLSALDPATVEGIRLTPRPGTEAAKEFSAVGVFFERGTGVPIGMILAKPDTIEMMRLFDVEQVDRFTADELARMSVEPPSDPRGWEIRIR